MTDVNEVPFFQSEYAQRDPRKPGNVLTVEIDCDVQSCILPSGQLVTQGRNRVELREDYLERTIALVADAEPCEGGVRTNPSKIEEAKARVAEAKKVFAEGKVDKDGNPIPWKHLQHKYDGPRHWVNEYVARNFPSVGGVYKSVLPLRAVRVVGEPKPQPPTDAERIAQGQLDVHSKALAQAIGESLAKHMGGDRPRKRSKPDNT